MSKKQVWHKMTGYPTKYCLIVGRPALEEFYRKKKTQCPETTGNAGLTISHENGYMIVWLDDDPKQLALAVNTIIHESVHVFQGMMTYIGEPAPGVEIQAYTIADIAETLLGQFAKYLEKTKCPT